MYLWKKKTRVVDIRAVIWCLLILKYIKIFGSLNVCFFLVLCVGFLLENIIDHPINKKYHTQSHKKGAFMSAVNSPRNRQKVKQTK